MLSVRPYDHRVDWWSLGILMYACLFGEYPVSATKDHISMANKVLNHKFHLPSNQLEQKSDVREVLCHLLEKNPNQRLCTLDELQQTSFMSTVDFERIYSKSYSPLSILMKTKTEWHQELQVHYYRREKPKVNGHQYQSSSTQLQHQYENLIQPLVSK